MKRALASALAVAIVALFALAPASGQGTPTCKGCFVGELQLSANPDDPNGDTKILMQDLFFVDPQGLVWKAGKGDKTDGASIPALFQPVVGGPWENDYLPAAVMHDHYTDDKHKVRPWRETDYMFYQAMLVRHVDVIKAKTMFYAVYVFGPHWDKLGQGVPCGEGCIFDTTTKESWRPADYSVTHSPELSEIEDQIRAAELSGKPMSLDDLKNLAFQNHQENPFVTTIDGKPIG